MRVAYDDLIRPMAWHVKFPSVETAQAAVKQLDNTRLGTRIVSLRFEPPEELDKATIRPVLRNFHERSVLVSGLPRKVARADLAHFFSDYALAPVPITVLANDASEMFRAGDRQQEYARAVVRFSTVAEAARAARELDGEFVSSNAVGVQLIS